MTTPTLPRTSAPSASTLAAPLPFVGLGVGDGGDLPLARRRHPGRHRGGRSPSTSTARGSTGVATSTVPRAGVGRSRGRPRRPGR